MEKIVRKLTFEEAEELDYEYWRKVPPGEKLDMVQRLREIYYSLSHENRKGLQRVYRIVEQA